MQISIVGLLALTADVLHWGGLFFDRSLDFVLDMNMAHGAFSLMALQRKLPLGFAPFIRRCDADKMAIAAAIDTANDLSAALFAAGGIDMSWRWIEWR